MHCFQYRSEKKPVYMLTQHFFPAYLQWIHSFMVGRVPVSSLLESDSHGRVSAAPQSHDEDLLHLIGFDVGKRVLLPGERL